MTSPVDTAPVPVIKPITAPLPILPLAASPDAGPQQSGPQQSGPQQSEKFTVTAIRRGLPAAPSFIAGTHATAAVHPAPAPPSSPGRTKQRNVFLAVTVLFVIAALALAVKYALPGLDQLGETPAAQTEVAIPTVAGKTPQEAAAILDAQGLRVGGQREANHPTVKPGAVAETDPAAGVVAAAGSVVTLIISTGPGNITVPQLTGLTLALAQETLATAGLTAGTITSKDSPLPAGQVLASTPGFGTKAASGSAVNLTVASGSRAIPGKLIGLTGNAAKLVIEAAGFRADTVFQDAAAGAEPGLVLSVQPASGTAAPIGSLVRIVVSRTPESTPANTPTPVPGTVWVTATPSQSPSESPTGIASPPITSPSVSTPPAKPGKP